MFKLLTEEEKHKVEGEYSLRRAIVMIAGLIFVCAVGIIGLMPSYLLSNIRKDEAEDRMRILAQSGLIEDTSEAEVWLSKVNQKLKALDPALDLDPPSALIAEILEKKINGISITNITLSKVKSKVTISVNGVAEDRQTLITFRDSISVSESFSSVVLPISNLTQDRDISFEIKLSPKIPKAPSDTNPTP